MFSNSSSSQMSVGSSEDQIQTLQSLYRDRKDAIGKRLLEFRQVMQWSDEDVFGELAFCLLTPQASAKVCWAAVPKLKQEKLLWKENPADLGPFLNQVRFGESK